MKLVGVGEKRDYHCLHSQSSRPKWDYYSELVIFVIKPRLFRRLKLLDNIFGLPAILGQALVFVQRRQR